MGIYASLTPIYGKNERDKRILIGHKRVGGPLIPLGKKEFAKPVKRKNATVESIEDKVDDTKPKRKKRFGYKKKKE